MPDEELLEFENTVEDVHGRSHVAVVLGAERDDGKWLGWIRFRDPDGHALETERETTQPNRNDLVYWSKGLTYSYLEGALARAQRRAYAAASGGRGSGPGAAPTPLWPMPGISRLEVLSLNSRPAEAIMGTRDPRPGMSRDVHDAGFVVYEGSTIEGNARRHAFAVQFGSDNAGGVLANWLWSRLRDTGAEVRVDGTVVEVRNDALKRAIVGR
ncbi:MAG: hypothetical protein ACREKM_05375 [Longimicrobiales bacterium]